MSSTPKIRFSPRASSARTPPSRMPLIAASTRKIGSTTGKPSSQHSPHRAPRLRLVGRVSVRKSDAHVRFADEVLLGELRGPAFHLDPPDFQQVRAVHQLEHLAHVLLDDEDGVALLTHAPDQVEDTQRSEEHTSELQS